MKSVPKISLQFSTETNIGSRILHYYDHTWCSHVDAVLPNGGLLGAKGIGGVKIRDGKRLAKTLVVELETTPEKRKRFYDFCRDQIGKPYDFWGILAFAFNRNWRDDDSWFCSELISAALEYSGFFPYNICAAHSKITPQNLLLMVNMFTPIKDPTVHRKFLLFNR